MEPRSRATHESPQQETTGLALALEAVIVLGVGALLILAATRIPPGQPEAGAIMTLAVVLHAVGAVRSAIRIADFFEPS